MLIAISPDIRELRKTALLLHCRSSRERDYGLNLFNQVGGNLVGTGTRRFAGRAVLTPPTRQRLCTTQMSPHCGAARGCRLQFRYLLPAWIRELIFLKCVRRS